MQEDVERGGDGSFIRMITGDSEEDCGKFTSPIENDQQILNQGIAEKEEQLQFTGPIFSPSTNEEKEPMSSPWEE